MSSSYHRSSHRWIINIEHQEPALAESASDMVSVAEALLATGKIEIKQGGERHILSPSNPCRFVLRYEQMAGGTHKLKIKLEWCHIASPSNPRGLVRISTPKS